MCLPYVKMYFQDHQLSLFFSMAQLTQILLFLEVLLFEKLKVTVTERHLFKKKFYGSFGFVSILRKKVFLGAPVKCFSLYGSNNSDSVAFGKPVLQRSKITVSERQLFKETFAMKVLGMGLSCLKRYLQEHQ